MRIYRMTATFGKLEQQTLTLKPGLNVVEAPNEWGKSTWCAFLLAMLYGLDTRAKTTKTSLADKERYAPWSGSPMSGRIDLHWQGRDITIERTTRGRVPMGVFRAYETDSGLALPELTAANCGQTLLGVESSVYRRGGFIRQADMPVTQDDALRRRLNDLVTTGDETGDGAMLEKRLKELKNRIRANRITGLIPQTEAERNAVEEKLRELELLEERTHSLTEALVEEKQRLSLLENHRAALEYRQAQADATRIADAQKAEELAQRRVAEEKKRCEGLPTEEAAADLLAGLKQYQQQWNRLLEAKSGQEPRSPELPEPFRGKTPEQIQAMVAEDVRRERNLRAPWIWLGLLLTGIAAGIAAVLLRQEFLYWAIGLTSAGAVCVIAAMVCLLLRGNKRGKLLEKYLHQPPAQWQTAADRYICALRDYENEQRSYRLSREELTAMEQTLTRQKQSLCGCRTVEETMESCREILRRWEALGNARNVLTNAREHLQTVKTMARTARPPAFADSLTASMEETEGAIIHTRQESQRLENRLEQYRGQMAAMGRRDQLKEQLTALNHRLRKLEEYYRALTLAQQTLANAQQELQRRFAPRISHRAQELLNRLTLGRYSRLMLGEDFSLLAGAEGENTLQTSLWRSEGTVDQLYLALRLAVAEELTPGAPLILDDVFVRFDDNRLEAALKVLEELSADRQILLFTCQSREKQILQ